MTDLTTPAVPDPRLAPDPYEALAADLAYSYRGVFSPETVAAEVAAARALLEPTATIPTYLRSWSGGRPASS